MNAATRYAATPYAAAPAPVLFLDFESILLSSIDPGAKPLFERVLEQMPYLGPLLGRYSGLYIVLSTPHVAVPLETDDTAPDAAQSGAAVTPDGIIAVDTLAALAAADAGFAALPRYEQILRYVQAHGVTNWLAVDDDAAGWPDAARARLIRVDSDVGLTDPLKQVELRAKLNRLFDSLA